MLKTKIFTVLLLCTWVTVNAQIRFPSIVGNNMVLQQRSEVAVWGWCIGGDKIELTTTWDNKIHTTTVNSTDNKWIFKVKTPVAGGPYTMQFKSGKYSETLTQVLIGEVWLCSGQSNMEMPLSGNRNQPIVNSDSLIANARNSQLRLFKVERTMANEPQKDVKGAWEKSEPEIAKTFSALGYQFASNLQQHLKVPVGIIQSTWGGTAIQAWMSKDVFSKFPELSKEKGRTGPSNPSTLFNGMIAPLIPYGIKGFLWYQGESDHFKYYQQYPQLMKGMVEGWRSDWNNKELPFYYVQIAPWKYTPDPYMTAPYMRESQANAVKIISNSGMAVTADIGSNKTIHPPDKTKIADRLLRIALANAYKQKNIVWRGPEVKKVKISGNQIVIKFSNIDDQLVLMPLASTNFEIAGNDQQFYPAKATLKSNNKLSVTSQQVNNPVAVRYGFQNYFTGNLFNSAGLPASPFRTDKWEVVKTKK